MILLADRDFVAKALKEHQPRKQRNGSKRAGRGRTTTWFCTSVGTPLDTANVRRLFRRITKAAPA